MMLLVIALCCFIILLFAYVWAVLDKLVETIAKLGKETQSVVTNVYMLKDAINEQRQALVGAHKEVAQVANKQTDAIKLAGEAIQNLDKKIVTQTRILQDFGKVTVIDK